jgi:signal transduction histidine kinase/CheY-like chemotaxis protein
LLERDPTAPQSGVDVGTADIESSTAASGSTSTAARATAPGDGEASRSSMSALLATDSLIDDGKARLWSRSLRQVTRFAALGAIAPIVVVALGIVARPHVPLMLAVTGVSLVIAAAVGYAARAPFERRSFAVIAAAFVLPNALLVWEAPIELLYGSLALVLYMGALLPARLAWVMHGLHMAAITAAIVLSSRYTLLPPGGALDGAFHFSTYLCFYGLAVVHAQGFSSHVREIHRALRDRGRAVADSHRELQQRLRARERELRAQHDELLRARKEEALRTLTRGLAHDVNNLLAAVQGNTELLEGLVAQRPEGTADPELRLAVERIHRAVGRGRTLTRRMVGGLDRLELDPEPTSLVALVDGVLDLLRPTLPVHIRVVVARPDPPPWALVDVAELEQALLNLLRNAIDAIDEQPGEIRIAIGAAGDMAWLEVSDTGHGIAPEHIERIYDPFFSTKGAERGTGLGLSQVLRVVRAHRGTIDVESTPGAGTRFRMRLPGLAGPRLAPRSDGRDSAAVRPRSHGDTAPEGLSILLVEDDDDVAEVIVAALPAAQVQRAATVAEGLDAAAALPRPADLVIVDRNLRGGRGDDLAHRLRRRWPAVPVLLISGEGTEALEPGDPGTPEITASLPKPFALRELRALVARLTAGAAAPEPDAVQPRGRTGSGSGPRNGSASHATSRGPIRAIQGDSGPHVRGGSGPQAAAEAAATAFAGEAPGERGP